MARSADAFRDVWPEIEALPAHRVLPNDVHVPSVATAVMMAVPQIEEVIAASAAVPDTFDLAKMYRLETYAGAAWYAYVQSFAVNASLLEGLSREATACREMLLMCAKALTRYGWIGKGLVAKIGQKNGTRALAHDVLELAELLCDAWPHPEVVGLEGWHLARSSAIGFDLLIARAVSSREPASDAEDTCARALSVLAYVYDDCRELIRALRVGEDDVDDIAPPIGVPSRPEEGQHLAN